MWLLTTAVAAQLFGSQYTLASHVFRAATTCGGALVLIAAITRLDPSAARDRGLRPRRGSGRALALGGAGHAAPFLVAAAVALSTGSATITINAPAGTAVGQTLLVLALVLAYEAVPEELLFRGYLFSVLRDRLPDPAVVVLQTLLFALFGLAIGAAAGLDRVLLFAVFGLCTGIVRAATGTVYASIGFHAAFQLSAQSLLSPWWTALHLDDPDRWFSDLALGLVPLLVGPLLVAAAARRKRISRPRPTP